MLSLQARFQTEEYTQSSLSKTINEVLVEYTPTAEIVRPKPDHVYDSMPGMKKTFLFMPVREGVTLIRRFGCWCTACMHSWAPGEGTMDSSFKCEECDCSEELPWEERSIGRTDASGISNARQRSLNKARELTKQLQAHFEKSNMPIWVAVQNRGEDDADQYARNQHKLSQILTVVCLPICRYWIGRALKVAKVYDRAGSVGRVRYDAGDCEIAVEWFQRDVSGGDERRTFKRWVANSEAKDPGPESGKIYTFNSTELRLISTASAAAGSAVHLEMQPLEPVGGTALRTCARLVGKPRLNYRNVTFHVTEVRAEPPESMWEITAGSERVILDNCW
jgi:hypothetical protein